MENKKITIEDLARMIDSGFKEAKKDLKDEIKSVNQKLDFQGERLEFLIDTSKRQFDDITERFNVLEVKLNGLSDRLDFVEKKIDSMGIMEKAILSEIKAIKDKLETKINRGEYLELEKRVIKLEKLALIK